MLGPAGERPSHLPSRLARPRGRLRLWLLVLLPVAPMALVSLAGVGIVLSLPGPASRQVVKADSTQADDRKDATEGERPIGVPPPDDICCSRCRAATIRRTALARSDPG